MTPADIFILLRQISGLSDEEILEAVRIGASELQDSDSRGSYYPAYHDLPARERQAIISNAMSITMTRLTAWRKRRRQVTWHDIHILLLGMRRLAG
jgi:hypothetical protein